MEQLQSTWNIVHLKLYGALWCFLWLSLGLNNITIVYARYRIWIGLIWPIPDPQKMTRIGAEPILSIGSMHPYLEAGLESNELVWNAAWRKLLETENGCAEWACYFISDETLQRQLFPLEKLLLNRANKERVLRKGSIWMSCRLQVP